MTQPSPQASQRQRDLDADLQRRARVASLFLEGEWGVELETFEADQERERQQAGRDR